MLRATVASLHKIERKRKIMVFDMGLTAWEMDQVKKTYADVC
jgi:hypothetical protein